MTIALDTRITKPDLNSQWLGNAAIMRSLGTIIMAPETAFQNPASLDLISSISKIDYMNFVRFDLYLATENATRLDRARLEMKVSKEIGEPDDFLDWDLYLAKEPPPKTVGTIKLRFKYVGRSKPIKIDDPWV
jgi:hypothetical protein